MSSHDPTRAIDSVNGHAVLRAASDRRGVRNNAQTTADWRGITLVHRGVDLGVVGRVSRGDARSEAVLHASGGISRSLEYAVPEGAIVGVLGVSARALVDDALEFEPQRLRGDGRVILVPRALRPGGRSAERDWLQLPRSAWVGMRVFADDGYLGAVEETVPALRPELAEALVVRARLRFRRTRFPVIPVSRILACTPSERVARVTGTRRELSSTWLQAVSGR